MRLQLRLKALKDQNYDINYNYKVQSFFYNLIKKTDFHHLHDFKGISSHQAKSVTPFCFSNIFPYGDMRHGNIRNLIVSSPNDSFIFLLHNKLMDLQTPIHFGACQFEVIECRTFSLKIINYPIKFSSITPIVIRIPQSVYQKYDLQLRYPYEYIFWRQTYPLELFLRQLEANLNRKFVNYYNKEPKQSVKFTRFLLRKQVSQKLMVHRTVQITIGTLWDFWFDEMDYDELLTFGLEAGFGERNSLGFGFLNLN